MADILYKVAYFQGSDKPCNLLDWRLGMPDGWHFFTTARHIALRGLRSLGHSQQIRGLDRAAVADLRGGGLNTASCAS